MDKIFLVMLAFFLLVFAMTPLLGAIQAGLDSVNGYYESLANN